MSNYFGSNNNLFEAYGDSYQTNPFAQGTTGPPAHTQAYAQAYAQAQMQAQMQAQRRAQMEAQRRAQMEAQRRAQLQSQQYAQYQAQMRQSQSNMRVDPRFQHTYQAPQLNPNASMQERMHYQNMMANQAREAQRRQYEMVQKEQKKRITHLLYYDSREPVCENSYKMCQGAPIVHMIDVMSVPENSVPECVTYLPAIIDVQGAKCYRGSRCEQYIKRMMAPKKRNNERFIDFISPTSDLAMPMTNFDKEDMAKQLPILESEMGGLDAVYSKWPTFSSDPKKAKNQSDMFLKRLKQRIDQSNIKVDPPVDDADENAQSQAARDARIQADIRKREQESRMPVRNGSDVVFEAALP